MGGSVRVWTHLKTNSAFAHLPRSCPPSLPSRVGDKSTLGGTGLPRRHLLELSLDHGKFNEGVKALLAGHVPNWGGEYIWGRVVKSREPKHPFATSGLCCCFEVF